VDDVVIYGLLVVVGLLLLLTLDCGVLVVDDCSDDVLLNRWSLCNLMEVMMVKGHKVGDGEGNQAMVMIFFPL
jgi:hypothetical protein